MKKILLNCISTFVLLILLVSCQKKNEDVKNTIEVPDNSSQEISTTEKKFMLKNAEDSLAIFDENSTDLDWFLGSDNRAIFIKPLDNSYELLTINPTDNTTCGRTYFIIDLEKRTCKAVPLIDTNPHIINKITYKNGKVRFYSDGSNAATTFKEFPMYYEYNIENDKVTKQVMSFSLNDNYTMFTIGMPSYGADENTDSQYNLKEINIHDSHIELDFDHTENAMLAGGTFAPSININPLGNNTLVIDMKSTDLDLDQDVVTGLKEFDFIQNAFAEEYIDTFKIHHIKLTFEFDDKIKNFSCTYNLYDDGFAQPVIYVY